MLSFTKEAISHRMLKNALSFWNLKSSDELDPIVKLLLEALSTELYQLSSENQNTHARTLDRVAQMLAPEYATCPIPARSLLHAQSVEPTEVLYPHHHFSVYKKGVPDETTGVAQQVELNFTPIKPIRLFDIKPAVLLSGNFAFTIGELLQKEASLPWNIVEMKQENSVWLGLYTNQPEISIQGLSLYFNFKMTAAAQVQAALRMLPFVKCYLGEKEISFSSGLQYESSTADKNASAITNHHPLHYVVEDVAAQYDKYFITLTDQILLKQTEAKAAPFAHDSPETLRLKELSVQNMHWLRIAFPHSVEASLLDQLEIHVNTFPCINLRLAESKYRLRQHSRIVPLRMANNHEQFLDIEQVSDNAQVYSATQYNGAAQEKSQGLYALVQGGIERFDTRSAKEHITNLLDLLRSESASFSAYGYDFVASTLKELQQKMALIEQKTASITQSGMEADHYLLVQPSQEQDLIFANYWCTTGAFGNGVKSDTKLTPVKHSVVRSGNVFLVQQTHGGKNRLKADERLSAFRYSMLSRNTIVTKQDILSFCELQLGNSVRSIKVERGYAYDEGTQQNFKRTIDVKITPTDRANESDWLLSCERLQAQLQARSGMSVFYRVMIAS